jgi:hypothetical protein
MQKKLLLWALILGATMAVGNVAWAQSDFYVIAAGPTAVGTKITSLPYTISNPGFYYLTGNLTTGNSNNGITVDADHVTIDLMGFSIAPSVSTTWPGIMINNHSNVEVRNGTVRGFLTGVWQTADTTAGNNTRVINIRALNNTYGIWLNGTDHLVKGCTASFNSDTGI